MYVNGGCCKICGGTDHLESRCPDDTEEMREKRRLEAKEEKRKERAVNNAKALKSAQNPSFSGGGGGGGGGNRGYDQDMGVSRVAEAVQNLTKNEM